jgi:hypothetical protein
MSITTTNKTNLSGASVDLLPKKKRASKKKKDADLAKRIQEALDHKCPHPNKEKRISMIEFIQGELQRQNKKEKRGRVLNNVVESAQKLPKLSTPIKRLNCYTTYTEGYPALIQKHFNPLMSPPQSVAPS